MNLTWMESLRLPHGNKECWRMLDAELRTLHRKFSAHTGWFVEKEPGTALFRYWCIDTSESEAFPDHYGPFPSLKEAQKFAETTYSLGE